MATAEYIFTPSNNSPKPHSHIEPVVRFSPTGRRLKSPGKNVIVSQGFRLTVDGMFVQFREIDSVRYLGADPLKSFFNYARDQIGQIAEGMVVEAYFDHSTSDTMLVKCVAECSDNAAELLRKLVVERWEQQMPGCMVRIGQWLSDIMEVNATRTEAVTLANNLLKTLYVRSQNRVDYAQRLEALQAEVRYDFKTYAQADAIALLREASGGGYGSAAVDMVLGMVGEIVDENPWRPPNGFPGADRGAGAETLFKAWGLK